MPENKKTKVGYVVTKGVWGGAQKYVYNLATYLPETFECFVICGEGGALKEKLERKGVRVYELTSMKRDISIFDEIKNLTKILKIIKRESPDILHLNSPKAGGLGGVVGRILGIKNIVYTSHGFSFNEDRGFVRNFLVILFTWLILVLSNKTIVISREEENQAKAMPFVSKKKIQLIWNGIENVTFKEKTEAKQELLKKVNLKTESEKNVWRDALIIGTIAELHKNKGLEYAVKAVSKIKKPIIYVIIGEGEERKNLENLIKELNCQSKVFLLGFIDNANEYLKAFDIFMLTSVKEGLPYTMLEAGLASLPVISTNISGMQDIVDSGVNGILITRKKIGEIERAIDYMIAHPKEANSYGIKLREKIERDFSVEKMIIKTIQFYQTTK